MHKKILKITIGLVFILSVGVTSVLFANETVVESETFIGPLDFFASGAPLAFDTNLNDRVDTIGQPANLSVLNSDIIGSASLAKAYLYWAGSVPQPSGGDCTAGAYDDQIIFTPPLGDAATVKADLYYCSDAASATVDMQSYRADVTSLIGSMIGVYTVDGFNALVQDGTMDNASFSLVLIYTAPDLPKQKISLYDGLQSFANVSQTLSVSELNISASHTGKLLWYVLDGDVSAFGSESVSVDGLPGAGGPIMLQDGFNPLSNPMNHTINTVSPVQNDSIGVDIDQFDISGALSAGDTNVDVTYNAGSDRWWLVYQLLGVTLDPNAENEPSAEELVAELLAYFDTAVDDGILTGNGPGNSATGRLGALRNMLHSAAYFIENDQILESCEQLQDSYRRADGHSRPEDFVQGSTAPTLAEKILELRKSLVCD